VFADVYSSLCLENPSQTDMVRSHIDVAIGSGASRTIDDWNISRKGVERVLRRAAVAKPQARRELSRSWAHGFRIEIEIGAVLIDFCEQAQLSIVHQRHVGNFRFDYLIGGCLLIEVDEVQHQLDVHQIRIDQQKDAVAAQHGFKLLRVHIPVTNVAKLLGLIVRMLNEKDDLQISVYHDERR
jgi:very-short-patch-repair endonuclease